MARRSQAEGSIYQEADGRWTGVIGLGRVGGKGRRKKVHGATSAEVRRKLTAASSASNRA